MLIKSEGVEKSLVGPIISKLESLGFKLIQMKMLSPHKDHFEKLYANSENDQLQLSLSNDNNNLELN